MKTTLFVTALLALCISGLHGQHRTAPSDQQSLEVKRMLLPAYPQSLLENGVSEGNVRIVLDVDHNGYLSDWLVVGYTHREFASAVEAAVRRWTFNPMRVGGEVIPSQIELNFAFSSKGAVVSVVGMNPGRLFTALASPSGEWPRKPQELDHAPRTVATVAPAYASELKSKGIAGTAVVEFYIDKNGTVRMPAVVESDFLELGVLALDAISKWSFEPATVGGRPVLVKARQVFHFGANVM